MVEAAALIMSQLAYGGLCLWAAWRLRTKIWLFMCLAPLLLISWLWGSNGGFPMPVDASADPFGMTYKIRTILLFAFSCLALVTAIGSCMIVLRSKRRFAA